MVLGPIDEWSMERRKKVGKALFVVGTVFVWTIIVPSIAIESTLYDTLLMVGGLLCLAGTSIYVLRPGRVYGSTGDALETRHE